MATSLLPSGGIALVGAPDSDSGFKDAKTTPMQAMQVDITQDIIDELLESVRSGKAPQILFGRNPVCVHTSLVASVMYTQLVLVLIIVMAQRDDSERHDRG
jgi:hypothetical protein